MQPIPVYKVNRDKGTDEDAFNRTPDIRKETLKC